MLLSFDLFVFWDIRFLFDSWTSLTRPHGCVLGVTDLPYLDTSNGLVASYLIRLPSILYLVLPHRLLPPAELLAVFWSLVFFFFFF